MRAVLIASFLLFVAAAPAGAQLSNLPKLTAPVNDIAGVIDANSARDLDARIRALKDATGNVVIVVTVTTIAPYATVDEYAVKLFEKAGIGDKKLDNGLLILVAVKEHGIRIEVGYGLEGVITDGFAGETIRQAMAPEFKAGRYGPGLLAGTTRLINRIHPSGDAAPTDAPTETPMSSKELVLGMILFLAIGLGILGIIIYAIYRLAKATGGFRTTASTSTGVMGSSSSDDSDRSSSSSSSSGSGFDGFSGGSSGGGGASGSW
ncbi:MAG: TPM domain-containing protein [Acidobacteriota bacterium]